MRTVSLLFLSILLHSLVSAQKKKAIELSIIGRYDQHGNYISNFANRAYNDTTKLYGTSYGANIIYRHHFTRTVSAYIGVGYYKLGIDKIKGSMPFNSPGIRTSRNIDYDDGVTNLLYGTSTYHYNNIAGTLGVNKTFLLRNSLFLDLGLEGVCYSTTSQQYELLDGRKLYSTKNSKPLEWGVNMTWGILKEFKKIYIRPAVLVPVYQNLKGDRVFYEEKKMNITKWFGGIGGVVRIGRYI
jgi:hypothetical protein